MILVGLSEIKFAESPETLKSLGLGSCIGVILYSDRAHCAGMAHVMLPDSSLSCSGSFSPGKYADTAVPALIRLMTVIHGLPMAELKAKMAGGAEMFRASQRYSTMSIGKRNAEAVGNQLSKYRVPLVAAETGHDFGRTIEFDPGNGMLVIRTILRGEQRI
ncbi:chemotaxis protein CheD [Sporolactobacillus vineae]|uniref:chemotaxis protein CheD n=1 Tax=Sporolactobacillus vineae TaxID=444463 RepID=UPI000287FE0D|nr:chemotaxis protein CheD [Sporolactobacillus vineae]